MDVNAPEFRLLVDQLQGANITPGRARGGGGGGGGPEDGPGVHLHNGTTNGDVMANGTGGQHSHGPGAGSGSYSPFGPTATFRSDYSFLQSVIADNGSHASNQLAVSSVAFDSMEELLWMGNEGGHVTSYYGFELNKYTSFQVHQMNDIRAQLTGDFGLLSLTKNYLRMSIRRGLPVFTHSSELFKNMQCMTRLPSGMLVVGGHQEQLIEFDLERVKQVRITEIDEQGCVIIRQHPKYICCGDLVGKITLRDLNTLRVQQTFNTHSGQLSDFDVHGNYLVTCGYSNRHGTYTPDRFLMVYDLRMMKAISPINVMFPPYLLRFVPLFSSKFCVVSQTGQFQLLDTSGTLPSSNPPFIHNAELPEGASITAFDVSSSCQALAFGDDAGCIHLYGASNEVIFNNFSQPTEFADVLDPVPPISFDDVMTPYSTIPMPYYGNNEKLFSDWPQELCKKVYRALQPIDPQILSTMRMKGSVGYAPNPGLRKRNQVVLDSGKGGKTSKSPNVSEPSEAIPLRYNFVEPNHNKVILDEYDFGRFNHSLFSGLDSTLPNSYSNNIIQSFYFIPLFRTAIKSHLCSKEFCLSCELAFLFHMLDIGSKQTPCQASNFLRAFRTMPEASALGLILPEDEELKKKVNFTRLSQSWLRFMLHQVHTELSSPNDVFETSSKSDQESIVTRHFGMTETRYYRCNTCDDVWQQEAIIFAVTLSLPENGKTSFAEVLKKNLVVEQSMPVFCEKCADFKYNVNRREPKSMPNILSINCGIENEKGIQFWKNQALLEAGDKEATRLLETTSVRKPCRYGNKCTRSGCKFSHDRDKDCSPRKEDENSESAGSWLPFKLLVKVNDSSCGSEKVEVSSTRADDDDDDVIEYHLIAVNSVIYKQEESLGGKGNIVSAVKVGKTYHKLHENKGKARGNSPVKDSEWYLFNHFSINPISEEEAVHLDLDWKVPSIVIYCKKELLEEKVPEPKNPITTEIFGEDQNLAAKSSRRSITFTPLSQDEMPKKEDVVAMDAEFVTLNQEETEIRSDGTRATIKPSQRSVARISCVRGSGLLEGQPFIDDYIATQEQVADYMTKFSGIQPGDLDITLSSKHLTTLKSTYLKLRFLVDIGITFVGHGLKNDFRVINLVVPPQQVIDTVYLFQSPHCKRMVSLRFLAWHFLGIKIQSETHDSIEDAKTALTLYRKHQELEMMDRVDKAIEELYEAGRNSGWKVPGTEEQQSL